MRKTLAVLATALLALPFVPGQALAAPAYPFQNPRLSMERRTADLVGRLTLDEKISLLHQYQPAIPRLGIKLFKAGTEALHGVAWSNDIDNNGAVVTANGTSFPQPVGLASTWDPALLERVGDVVADEARGYHAQNDRVWGLNLWAPVVNLLRDPRWGRNEEGYSEDPLLTGAISTAYGNGLEGDDPRYLKTAPTLKHYLAYNNEKGRDVTSSNVPQRVLNEYDRAAFKPALEAGAATGVMASYNLINGRPATVDPDLGTLVRSWSDQPLFNVSDAYAPYNLTGSQKYYATQPEANAAVIKAGLDSFTIDDGNGTPTVTSIKAALAQGLLTTRDIDAAAGHALSIRFRLGEFDPDGGPYARIGADVINAPAHQALARETAADAMVLLKNDRKALPLATGKDVAVVGPLGDVLYSDWYGAHLPYQVTAADGIRERAKSVTTSEASDRIALKDVATGRYVTSTGSTDTTPVSVTGTTADAAAQFDAVDWGQGVNTLRNVGTGRYLGYNWGPFITRDEQPNGWYVQQQFKLEAQSDGTFVIHYAGYETQESWFGANTYVTVGADGALTLGSPDAAGAAHFTKEILSSGIDQAVAAAKKADTAVVVVGSMPFINGREAHDRSTTALGEGQEALVRAVLKANPNTVVVLQTSYPDSITWEQEHVPAIVWTTHAGAETGHAIADVLFGSVNPAGRLTQTWPRDDSTLPADLNQYDIIKTGQTYLYSKDKPLYPFGFGLSYTDFRYSNLRVNGTTATVEVTNTGKRAGDEVVQLYTHQRTSRDKQPLQQLRAFDRVSLQPGQKRTVTLHFDRADLAHWDVTRERWVVEDATHDILVGSSSADIRARGTLHVNGETIPVRDLTRTTRAEAFDDYSGAALVDESKARGTAVGANTDGDWVSYKRATIGSTFTAKVAKESAGTGTIQIRQGSATGKLLGTVQVPSTGNRYTYVSTSAKIAAARGDVYLVLSAGVRLAEFRGR
ncbi:glycoside hydrolase family 3 protein [Winogradskya consettensis]|uniref:Exo-alpha-(1->6)-L-arabinopyranosidase n=1 Tax=Winogradskya consettensis TaxID=113560 RepID=A0A919SEH6_9ACTN|nr:glycoside hydrolase family 3 protein [Actinoplanes consettensis]GIM70927.1 beta-glucosidase [Actinoplanes consettensis]